MDLNEKNEGPEFEVCNHLYSGLDLARMELEGFPEDTRTFLTNLGNQICALRMDLVADEENKLADVSPSLLQYPWIKYASDIAFAEEALGRLSAVFDRYLKLRPVLTSYKLSDEAVKCLQEAGRMFLYSFDSGCVMFCGAALEQTLRKVLENADNTPGEKDTIGCLITKANKCKLLSEEATKAAHELKDARNGVIHRPFKAGDDLKDESLKAMDNIGKVFEALGRDLSVEE